MQRLIVLCGGLSEERAVSLRSGAAVAEALAEGNHAHWGQPVEVLTVDPAETDLAAFAFEAGDIAVNILHGRFGEDGGVQDLLAGRGVRLTGCDADSSRLTFSKLATRQRLESAGLPIPRGHAIDGESLPADLCYPLVVKPDRSGSSARMHFVAAPADWSVAAADATRDGAGLVEEHLGGSEWTVSVLGREPLPPIEVRSPRPVFDSSAKYDDDATSFHPIDPDRADARAMQRLAVSSAEACGTRGLVRVDLRASGRDEADLRILEINTVPGMTERSLSPLAAMAAGMSLPKLAYWIVGECVGRDER